MQISWRKTKELRNLSDLPALIASLLLLHLGRPHVVKMSLPACPDNSLNQWQQKPAQH